MKYLRIVWWMYLVTKDLTEVEGYFERGIHMITKNG